MSWVPGEGLVAETGGAAFLAFDQWSALNGRGVATDPPVSATFAYDDTCEGAMPDGGYKRVASEAVNLTGPYSAEFAALVLGPVEDLGADLTTLGIGVGVRVTGQITGLTVSMDGWGELDMVDDALSAAAGSAQIVGGLLPWSVGTGMTPPVGFLLRPSAIAYPGSSPGNEANRILWRPGEIGVVRWSVTVDTISVRMAGNFGAQGYRIP